MRCVENYLELVKELGSAKPPLSKSLKLLQRLVSERVFIRDLRLFSAPLIDQPREKYPDVDREYVRIALHRHIFCVVLIRKENRCRFW